MRVRVGEQQAVDLGEALGSIAGTNRNGLNGPDRCGSARDVASHVDTSDVRASMGHPRGRCEGSGARWCVPAAWLIGAGAEDERDGQGDTQKCDCVRMVHFLRNLLTRVPKAAHGLVASLVRSIFAQPDEAAVYAQHARVAADLRSRFPAAADLLDAAGPDLLAFATFPVEHWRQIWSNNPQERLNREIRRRTDVVGIFPHRAAVLRLVGAVLAEPHDEWAVARRYMSVESLAKLGVLPAGGEHAQAQEVKMALPQAG